MSDETNRDPGRVYRILGELYLEPPTDSTVGDVATWADRWLESGSNALTADIREPLETLRGIDPGDPKTLRAEFTRLFRGETNQPSPDPPYESLYREDTIYGSKTTEVRGSYLQAGMDITDDENREPPDHIGIELQFLGELRSKEATENDESKAQIQAFIEEHLMEWFDDFEDAVQKNDPPAFYAAVVRLTGAVLRGEADRLEIAWQ